MMDPSFVTAKKPVLFPDYSYLKAIWILVKNVPCMILTFTIGKFRLL